MKLAVITRIHYKADDPRFPKRVEMYKKYTLASLLNQTDQDFDILVWCEPHHDELFLNLSDRIKVFHADTEVRYKSNKYFVDYTPFSKVYGMDKYEAQLGLDSDDEIKPTAIEEIKKHLKGERKAISLQPIKRDTETGKTYKMFEYKLRGKLSPVFCLYQPDEPYIFAYEYGHFSEMPNQFKNKVYLYDLAIMNIHGENESTEIERIDKKI